MEALIFDGVVVQIEAIQFPVAPALKWIDITGIAPQPEVGWSFDGRDFAPPPPPPVDPVVAPRQQIINKLRADPIFKAGILDSFEARGITDRTAILDALEAKFADTRI